MAEGPTFLPSWLALREDLQESGRAREWEALVESLLPSPDTAAIRGELRRRFPAGLNLAPNECAFSATLCGK